MVTLMLTLLFCASALAQESFRLSNIYSNDMVLQMAPKSAQIWGWGEVDASILVQMSAVSETTSVGSDGKWSVRLPPQMAGGPYQLTITHAEVDEISLNVWFGDIWVCSGQSNMEFSMSQVYNSTEEIDKALTYQNLRLLHVPLRLAEVEKDELIAIDTPWGPPSLTNLPDFSALCVMFGERISDSLGGRPIGLIDTTVGGTYIEAWSSKRVLNYCNAPSNPGAGGPNSDNILWNGMVHPLTKMAVRGAIWYQGEANTDNNEDYYSCHIQRLAEDWKMTFVDGNISVTAENNVAFPFGIAQLGPTRVGGESRYGYLRWHQTVDQGVLPNVFMPEAFMGAAYDLTDHDSPTGEIHPRDKQTIADRLANSGKVLLYGENWHMNGPMVESLVETTPGVITLTYDTDVSVQGTKGFSIRRSDGTWVETSISGSSGRDVDVNVESGATHLAYAWSGEVCDYKMCAIYSADVEALPAQVWLWELPLA